MHRFFLIALCINILQLAGYPQEYSYPNNLIHFGDVIDVDIVGSTEYDWRGTLNNEGQLDGLDFVSDRIIGLCRTEEEVAASVAKGFSYLLRDPQVVVKILDRSGRPISFLDGAVMKPQRFVIKRLVRLNELLVMAGGISEKASGEIQIIRPKNLSCAPPDPINGVGRNDGVGSLAMIKKDGATVLLNVMMSDLLRGDKTANPIILNGDIISVFETAPIYVIGGVANPRQINARSQLTVLRAIDSAGGFSRDANIRNINIFRRADGATAIISVDYESIKAGKLEDILLQKFDIVEVGQTGRDPRKFPPAIIDGDLKIRSSSETPLRIVE